MAELTSMLPTSVKEDDTFDIGYRWESGEIDSMEALCLLLEVKPYKVELFIYSGQIEGESDLPMQYRTIAKDWDYRFFEKQGMFPRV